MFGLVLIPEFFEPVDDALDLRCDFGREPGSSGRIGLARLLRARGITTVHLEHSCGMIVMF